MLLLGGASSAKQGSISSDELAVADRSIHLEWHTDTLFTKLIWSKHKNGSKIVPYIQR